MSSQPATSRVFYFTQSDGFYSALTVVDRIPGTLVAAAAKLSNIALIPLLVPVLLIFFFSGFPSFFCLLQMFFDNQMLLTC
jgi:hypothetical protein